MNIKYAAPLFYFGILISSIGSFTFNLALIAFMIASGFSLAEASLIIGLQRFIPIMITGIWGHLTDEVSPRLTVAVAETIAAITSIVLLTIWDGHDTNYKLLVLTCVVRSIVVSFQVGSRAKITKFFSSDTYASNSRQAIWFNKATQGATLFAGLAAWIIIRYFDFKTAIIFDAASFVINGAIALLIPTFSNSKSDSGLKVRWVQKFKDLFNYNRRAAIFDIFLAVTMMGTVAFTSRIAGSDQSWIGIYTASFGLAVWVAGFLERGVTSKMSTTPFWILLGISYGLLGILHGPNALTFLICFIKDCSYWVILHRISSHVQMDTPAEKMGGVSSARTSIMIAILASGEMLVGGWAEIVPVSSEGVVRGVIALAIGIYLISAAGKVHRHDRPSL